MTDPLQILVRQESSDDLLAQGAQTADDIDMIISPRDGKLVVVAQKEGVHVCGRCLEQFVDDPSDKRRPVEHNPGGYGTRIFLHAGCVSATRKRPNLIKQLIDRHQARRFLTKAVKPFLPKNAG